MPMEQINATNSDKYKEKNKRWEQPQEFIKIYIRQYKTCVS